jgi:hypothetical protein
LKNGQSGWGDSGRRVVHGGAIGGSPELILELALMGLFLWGLVLHYLRSRRFSPRAPKGGKGWWKRVHSGGASSLTFGEVAGSVWRSSGSDFSFGHAGGGWRVSSSSATSQAKSARGGVARRLAGASRWEKRGLESPGSIL